MSQYDPVRQYVYFGCDKELRAVKVGISKQPMTRLKGLGFTHIEHFKGSRELEQDIHEDLAPYRLHGEYYSYPEACLYLKGFLRREVSPESL